MINKLMNHKIFLEQIRFPLSSDIESFKIQEKIAQETAISVKYR